MDSLADRRQWPGAGGLQEGFERGFTRIIASRQAVTDAAAEMPEPRPQGLDLPWIQHRMNLEAFVLGTGGMMPCRQGVTSVLVAKGRELFLFDCGKPRSAFAPETSGGKKITRIFISHTHADHVTGLPGILMLSSQGPG